MLIDEISFSVSAGRGGSGSVSFGPKLGSGPDGGNGGKGGDVYFVATRDITALKRYTKNKLYRAENGKGGGKNKKTGANGKDLEMVVPTGTKAVDRKTGEIFEIEKDGERLVICKGGLGGKGNFELRSSTNTTPKTAQPGLEGEKKTLDINLRLIADLGLIGLPNAGKSSLLNALTNTRVKTANYPFTTLEPNLGDFYGKIIADIPGLIEGASLGRGLGIKFLKHIEKVPVLIHCIASDSKDVLADYKSVVKELNSFNPKLLKKKEIILLTKTDLITKEELERKEKVFKKMGKEVGSVSIYEEDSLKKLATHISHL